MLTSIPLNYDIQLPVLVSAVNTPELAMDDLTVNGKLSGRWWYWWWCGGGGGGGALSPCTLSPTPRCHYNPANP